MTAPSPWWDPARHADRRPFLLARGRIVTALRRFFTSRDFVEVETPALQVSPGNEAHLHAFSTELIGPDARRQPLYLRTSPEFSMKKLLAAGEKRIFDFARVFRNRERGALHHPEFTLLEWYRVDEPYESLMADCTVVLTEAAEAAATEEFWFRGAGADAFASPEHITVADAFREFAGFDLLRSLGPAGEPDRRVLASDAARNGTRIAEDDSWADIFSRVLVERIEPRLGIGRPTILCDYPITQAALARPKPDDPRLAERFELYLCGVEIANGFGELVDAREQRRRFEDEMSEKSRLYGERHPIDEDFLSALAVMPPASGIALGLDRLVMLASGASRIEQVLWAPVADIAASG